MPTFTEQTLTSGASSGAASDDLVFVCGIAIDSATMSRLPAGGSIADETNLVLDLIADHLRQSGCTLADVVKTTCYVSDESYRMEFIAAYRERFAPGPYPARCTFSIGLAGDCRVQIDAIAYRGAGE